MPGGFETAVKVPGVSLFPWVCALFGVGGGVLWALSPLGVRLSEYAFRAPALFWKLFPAAPALMLFGLLGLYLFFRGRGGGPAATVGFYIAALGVVLAVAGNLGLYHLGLDDIFIMSAPAYRTFRLGLFVFAAGTLLFAFLLAGSRAVPLAGSLPLVLGAFAGAVAVFRDFGEAGAAMWVAFGVGFAWCSSVVVFVGVARYLRNRRAGRVGERSPVF
ncbi:hypothetical protein [Rubrobacter indicoceani]|uniref:hypothetical protein n=1 Tax=Rubrobacter indicoceani TaxID=2051957 RepID=UPI0013C4A093|nr:hypothetical protein [Rubrobacter indicoceani]